MARSHAPTINVAGSGHPAQGQIPIQPVDKPILCSPYVEPDQHWVYDQSTGIPKRTPGRRPASYWYKTECSGSAQQQLGFMAEEDRDDLPLVNALREDVRRWCRAACHVLSRRSAWPTMPR